MDPGSFMSIYNVFFVLAQRARVLRSQLSNGVVLASLIAWPRISSYCVPDPDYTRLHIIVSSSRVILLLVLNTLRSRTLAISTGLGCLGAWQ